MNSSGKTFDPVHGRYNSDIRTIEMGGLGYEEGSVGLSYSSDFKL